MLACICPGSSSSDHTLNTLRYAVCLKERGNTNNLYNNNNANTYNPAVLEE
jgi:hypothetical protein